MRECITFALNSCGSLSWSCESARRASPLRTAGTHFASKPAVLGLEPWQRTSHATLPLKTTLHPELRGNAPRTTFVLKSCELRPGAAYYCCTQKLRFVSRVSENEHASHATSVLEACDFAPGAAGAHFKHSPNLHSCGHALPAFGSRSRGQNSRTAPQQECLDTHLRRGFSRLETHSRAPQRALPHAQSPQRVRRAQNTFAPQRVLPSPSRVRAAPQRERTHDLHKGFTATKTSELTRRHSESDTRNKSASTRTISAEGLPSSRHIRAVPQPERFDKHDPRRGFATLLLKMMCSPRNPEHQHKTFCAHHESVTECRAGHGVLPSAHKPRRNESAVVKKGPLGSKLSHARQLLEVRFSNRRSLTDKETSTA